MIIRIAIMLLVAGLATAGTVDAPLAGGTINVHYGSSPPNPDALATVSIGARPIGGGALVFCAEIDAAGEVQGATTTVNADGPVVFVEGVAFSAAGCTGVESLPSADNYRIVFAGPGRPLLIPASPFSAK